MDQYGPVNLWTAKKAGALMVTWTAANTANTIRAMQPGTATSSMRVH
jgi:hypothetical protein